MDVLEASVSEAVTLPGSLDIGQAEGLRAALLAQLALGDIVIEAGAVERVTTPGLQVLAAAAKSARARGAALRIRGATDALRHAIADLGLSAAIPCEA